MTSRPYLLVSGIIFALVALSHAARVINGWTFILGPCEIPMWISWCGLFGPGALAVWAFLLVAKPN